MEKYTIPNYHEELFGDSVPRTKNEIMLKIFGTSGTDDLESWARLSVKDKKDTEKFFYDIDLSSLTNYCIDPGWQHVYARNKHVILIEDIRKYGIKVPLLVIGNSEGTYAVVEGHHRAGAAKLLSIKKIKCFVLKMGG